MKLLEKAKNILEFLLDCLFPRCCSICNRKADTDDYNNLCSSCVAKIPWIVGNCCSLCSRPIGEQSSEDALICDECRADPPAFKDGMSCWLHKGAGRDIVLTLKYRNADYLKNDIAALLKNNCERAYKYASDSVLVPVPVSYFRSIRRGYNQTEVIAEALKKISSNSIVANILESKNKKSQTKLKRGERLINAKNKFECSSMSNSIPRSSRIVLVDDVSTTGATVRECCRVLHMAGFSDLHVLTLSYG